MYDDLMYKDPAKQREANRRWYLENKERALENYRKYYRENKEAISETKKKYRHRPDVRSKINERALVRYHCSAEYRARSLELAALRRIEWRKRILQFLGETKCVRCGYDDWRALQVDHINGGGRLEFRQRPNLTRAKQYYEHIQKNPTAYQVLCSNCNWIKRFENKEVPNYRK